MPEDKPIATNEVEEIVNGNDPYTWVDEITNNALKTIGFIWLLAGFLDVDKNLIYGFFSSSLPAVITYYVLQRKKKKEDDSQ